MLLAAGENVPVEAHFDFKQALERAAKKCKAKKITEFLPFAYNEYLLNRSMGLGATAQALKNMKSSIKIRAIYYEMFIGGKKQSEEKRRAGCLKDTAAIRLQINFKTCLSAAAFGGAVGI